MKEVSNDILNALLSIGYVVSIEGQKMLNFVVEKMTETQSDEMAEEILLEKIDVLHYSEYELGKTILYKSLVDSETPEDANVLVCLFCTPVTIAEIGNELCKSLQESVECDIWTAIKQVTSKLWAANTL